MCTEMDNLENLSLSDLEALESGFGQDISMTGADLRAIQAAIVKAMGYPPGYTLYAARYEESTRA